MPCTRSSIRVCRSAKACYERALPRPSNGGVGDDQLPPPRWLPAPEVTVYAPAWEGGQRGVLTASRAREQGFAKLIANNPSEITHYYNLPGESVATAH